MIPKIEDMYTIYTNLMGHVSKHISFHSLIKNQLLQDLIMFPTNDCKIDFWITQKICIKRGNLPKKIKRSLDERHK